MKILVVNAGSTSLKFKLYEMPEGQVLAQCGIERVGSLDDGVFRFTNGLTGAGTELRNQCIPDYRAGIRQFLACLEGTEYGVIRDISEIERVGFKTTLSKGHPGVHELDKETLQGMEDWIAMAPLHNRAYLNAIAVMREVLPEALFVGCFETAFHQSIPAERRVFGVPFEWVEKYGVRGLGYHGASHGYIADVLNERLGAQYAAISCHLGGSCSVCAIEDGKSADISFGMSLESGLIHANRVGDIDSGMIWFLKDQGLTDDEIRSGFREKGGLLGISGVSNDLRYVMEAAKNGHYRSRLAIDVFVTGIVHYIGAFYLDLGRLDALVFTAGIGEHSPDIRRMVSERLKPLGVRLDPRKNETVPEDGIISEEASSCKVFVIPADEEKGIARRTYDYR